MKKKTFIIFIVSIFIICGMPERLFAESKNVKVNIPNFKVTLNDMQVDNTYRKYPLIEYNDITYFPMTYYDSRYLGLETKWDNKDGLEIIKTGVAGGYRDYIGKVKNGKSFNATIPSFNININGKTIDNSKEKYPLIIFRDVTYFPLTWRFALDEFGWEYKFDSNKGLEIKSTNPKVKQLSLPNFSGGEVVGDGKSYYYQGEKGVIYQAFNSNNFRKVYQLPILSYGDGTYYVNSMIYKKDGEIWLWYHQGGSVMGSDSYIRLNSDGTYEEVESGYMSFKTYGDITLLVNQSIPPGEDNLTIKNGKENYKKIGNPSYLYGWVWEKNEESLGGSPSEDIYLLENDVYLLGFNVEGEDTFSKIHRVNLDTNETTKVSDAKVKSFLVDGDYIYFISEGKLYKLSLENGKEENIEIQGSISDYYNLKVLNGNIYYVNSQNGELYMTGMNGSLNPGAKVKSIIQDENYIICLFDEDASVSYRIMAFDLDGKLAFKSSDIGTTTFINNHILSYVENTTKKLYIVDLKK